MQGMTNAGGLTSYKADRALILVQEAKDIMAQSGGSNARTGITLADVTDVIAIAGDRKVEIRWTDPDDVTYNGATLAKWAGTKLVRKEGSAPENVNDGTLVLDSTARNAYATTAYEDNRLTNGTTYYYRFFPYTTEGAYTAGTSVDKTLASKPRATMTLSSSSIRVVAGGSKAITVTSNSMGEIFAVSNDTNLATVSVTGNTVTITGVAIGSATVTISQDEDENCLSPDEAVVEITIPAISNVLNENSWELIAEVAQAGQGNLYWDIGDCKEITLNGNVGNYLTLSNTKLCVFILDFNHPMNGAVENNIIFGGFKTALTNGVDVALVDDKYNAHEYDREAGQAKVYEDGTITFNINHWGSSNRGGWKGSDLRYDVLGATSTPPSDYGKRHTTLCVGYDATEATLTSPKANTLLAALPSDLRSNMRLWTRFVDAVGYTSEAAVDASVEATVDAITLLNDPERLVTAEWRVNSHEFSHNTRMAYYANGNGHIKKKHSDGSTAVSWWESSPAPGSGNTFRLVTYDQRTFDQNCAQSCGLAPVFKL